MRACRHFISVPRRVYQPAPAFRRPDPLATCQRAARLTSEQHPIKNVDPVNTFPVFVWYFQNSGSGRGESQSRQGTERREKKGRDIEIGHFGRAWRSSGRCWPILVDCGSSWLGSDSSYALRRYFSGIYAGFGPRPAPVPRTLSICPQILPILMQAARRILAIDRVNIPFGEVACQVYIRCLYGIRRGWGTSRVGFFWGGEPVPSLRSGTAWRRGEETRARRGL